MPTGPVWYDPTRIPGLARRVHAALEHLLRGPDVADPLAAPAHSTLRLVRAHLEHDWLPQLTRISTSTAMTGSSSVRLPPPPAPASAPVAGGESGPPASNSLESALNPAPRVDVPRRPPSTQAVLGDGWTFGCGPVSATTGQEASGCEWMPPERWDLTAPLLVASVLPVSGEVIDAVDCLRGAVPCEVLVVPFLSGRSVDVVDDVVTGAARASDVVRPFALGSADSWRLSETLERHFVDHGADFASTSPEHYALQASEFLVRGVSENLPTKIDPRNGQIRIYDDSTNTFGSYDADGTTATFFKPDPAEHGFPTNMDYWMDQPG